MINLHVVGGMEVDRRRGNEGEGEEGRVGK